MVARVGRKEGLTGGPGAQRDGGGERVRATRTTARSRPRRGAGWRAGEGGVLGREVTRAAWAGLGCWFQVSVGLGFGFIFLSISISISTPLSLFLIQTGFEFKYKFEFDHTQIIESMHQHECNIKKKLNL